MNVNKLPISGATILVNNSPRTESNEQGSYQLDEIKEGTYAITAKKKHYEFDTVTVELSSSNPVIPDITAKKYSAFLNLNLSSGKKVAIFVDIRKVHEK